MQTDRETLVLSHEPPRIACRYQHCHRWFYPDPSQPAKAFCSTQCRMDFHNEETRKAHEAEHPEPRWEVMPPGTATRDDWDTLAAFAGGTPGGASVWLEMYQVAVTKKKKPAK